MPFGYLLGTTLETNTTCKVFFNFYHGIYLMKLKSFSYCWGKCLKWLLIATRHLTESMVAILFFKHDEQSSCFLGFNFSFLSCSSGIKSWQTHQFLSYSNIMVICAKFIQKYVTPCHQSTFEMYKKNHLTLKMLAGL